MSVEELSFKVDGARLHAEWRRPAVPGKPALVFLHDGLGSAETWRGFPDLLADAMDLGAFHYDRWGYGRSAPRDPWPDAFIEEEAARLPKILHHADIADYALVGHSDGATIALIHAATRPEGLRAVVSIAAHVCRDPRAYREVVGFARAVRAGEIPDWLERFHGARGAQVVRSWADGWKRRLDADWDIRPDLPAIDVPLYATQGDADTYTHPLQLDSIARGVSGSETRLLPGVGHFPHIEDAEGLTAPVATFLRRCGL